MSRTPEAVAALNAVDAVAAADAVDGVDAVLLADPVVTGIPVVDDGSVLVDLREWGLRVEPTPPAVPFGAAPAHRRRCDNRSGRATRRGPAAGTDRAPGRSDRSGVPDHGWARATLAQRLARADANLPNGIRLLVVEGLRPLAVQQRIHDGYRSELAGELPWLTDDEIDRMASRFVSPPGIAPHVSGAAIDLTLVGPDGRRLDLGTEIDATPEQSGGACYLDAPGLSAEARAHRELLAEVLTDAGLVNYPTEWWHWSFGDRWWAHVTGRPFAVHGPVADALHLVGAPA